jgi:hypothetical protein
MIWIFITVIALMLVFVWSLMRIAALADRQAEQWYSELRSPRWADDAWRRVEADLDDAHIHVAHGPYDHEANGDFDGDRD